MIKIGPKKDEKQKMPGKGGKGITEKGGNKDKNNNKKDKIRLQDNNNLRKYKNVSKTVLHIRF